MGNRELAKQGIGQTGHWQWGIGNAKVKK